MLKAVAVYADQVKDPNVSPSKIMDVSRSNVITRPHFTVCLLRSVTFLSFLAKVLFGIINMIGMSNWRSGKRWHLLDIPASFYTVGSADYLYNSCLWCAVD